MEEKSPLEQLKIDYDKLRKKYNLPSFKDINCEFDIEEASEHETECVLRLIRKHMMDKVSGYLRFVEMLLNPTNAPMLFFALVKGLTPLDKRLLEKLYEEIGEFEVSVVALDCRYSEENEAKFINHLFSRWKDISQDLLKISEVLKKNWNKKTGESERGYCG